MSTGGDQKKKCFDHAARLLARRAHSKFQLTQKLRRNRFANEVIEAVIADLQRLGYVNDQEFAQIKAESDLSRRKQGKRRTMQDLARAGVSGAVAEKAVEEAYKDTDQQSVALVLAMKHRARLLKLDPETARRRLSGLLQRRGFDADDIRLAIKQTLSADVEE